MKIKQSSTEKSFSTAIEQMAQFLRAQVKLKDRSTKALAPSVGSFENSIERIAKLLRSQIHRIKTLKKRSWKKHAQSKHRRA